jgi:hypothetical protein
MKKPAKIATYIALSVLMTAAAFAGDKAKATKKKGKLAQWFADHQQAMCALAIADFEISKSSAIITCLAPEPTVSKAACAVSAVGAAIGLVGMLSTCVTD